MSAVTIAIAGGSASGKSTLATRLCGALVSCAIACRVIGTDRYFRRDDADAPRFLFSSSGEFEFNATTKIPIAMHTPTAAAPSRAPSFREAPGGAPHFGQASALSLIFSPHSLQATKVIAVSRFGMP